MDYYHFVRREIQPLLPPNPLRILDVGAGAGSTLKWLKSVFPNAQTTGVELNPELYDELRQNSDIAIVGDIGDASARLGTYDLIILLDVLEHLWDALGTLQLLVDRLEPGGQVIVSLPNVSHFSISIPLLLKRQFTYQDAGILDRTHRTFFVEESAVKLLNGANLVVTKGLISGLTGPKSKLIDRLSFGLFRHHLAKQYIMLGRLADPKVEQSKIQWKPLSD
jgi:2-polyprenyl-3-methyl-5-hydroxy-6-metoxy-1,4-benzoquinol methylase